MFRKSALIPIILILVMVGLQFWGKHDFTQVALAWQKYNQTDKLTVLFDDLITIIQGDTVRDSLIPASEYHNVYYRWTDEWGNVQYSERRPNVDSFEEIQAKDLPYNVQPTFTEEEKAKME